jgi:hypothetical protein
MQPVFRKLAAVLFRFSAIPACSTLFIAFLIVCKPHFYHGVCPDFYQHIRHPQLNARFSANKSRIGIPPFCRAAIEWLLIQVNNSKELASQTQHNKKLRCSICV